MTKEQEALNILIQICNKAVLPLENYPTFQNAVGVLAAAITPKPEEPKVEPENAPE